MGNRERLFECVFEQGGIEHRCLVRAWNEAQAVEEVRELLREKGMPDPVGLVVHRPGAAPSRKASLEPASW